MQKMALIFCSVKEIVVNLHVLKHNCLADDY